jgi:hypothetical protein
MAHRPSHQQAEAGPLATPPTYAPAVSETTAAHHFLGDFKTMSTFVFYSPAQACVIDTAKGSPPRAHHSGQTLEEMRERYPDAQYIDIDQAADMIDDAHRRPVSETTAEHFEEMLNVLPPRQWVRGNAAESFKISERTSGSITAIYARIGERYFEMQDNMSTPHDEIMRRCYAYMEATR